MLRSGLPSWTHATTVAMSAPAAAAMLVLRAISAIAPGSAAIVEPGLNPNQPSQRMNVPMVARPMLWPGIGRIDPSGRYLPSRGPSIQTPARARPAADRVHHRRAGEVGEAASGEPAAAPRPVPADRVDEPDQDHREHHEGRELDPLGDRAADDGRRRSREHQLEEELGVERDARPVERACRRPGRRRRSPGCCRRHRGTTRSVRTAGCRRRT